MFNLRESIFIFTTTSSCSEVLLEPTESVFADITTAGVAKQALEGHCIYDGGYCKLHLSYSRHTDLNVKV